MTLIGSGKIRGLEELATAQRVKIEPLVKLAPQGAVLVNVLLVGEELRPLVLFQQELWILREVLPASVRAEDALTYFQKISNCGFSPFYFGQSPSGIWTMRRFYKEILAEVSTAKISAELAKACFLSGMKTIRTLKESRLLHGNFGPNNFGFDGARDVRVLDFGLHMLGTAQKSTDLDSFVQAIYPLRPKLEPTLSEAIQALSDGKEDFDGLYNSFVEVRSKVISASSGRTLGSGRIVLERAPEIPKARASDSPSSSPAEAKSRPLSQPPQTAPKNPVLLWILIPLLVALALLYRFWSAPSDVQDFDIYQAWTSNQPILMSRVARVALDNPVSESSQLIFEDSLSTESRPNVLIKLLRDTANPLWFGELSARDREMVLSIALGSLIPDQSPPKFDLANAHPAVLFALTANSDLNNPSNALSNVSANSLSKLPDPIGNVFSALQTADSVLTDPAIAGAAHIISGDVTTLAVAALFTHGSGQDHGVTIVQVLKPIFMKDEKLAADLLTKISEANLNLSALVNWFLEEKLGAWQEVKAADRLTILTGMMPAAPLGVEKYGDLLKFPLTPIRRAAEQILKDAFLPAQDASTLSLLAASATNYLSRQQTIALILALQSKGERREALISTWFRTAPDAEMVLGVLFARAGIKDDSFNLEAARYLVGKDFQTNIPVFQKLLSHSEPMARALAISRLDPQKKAERSLLEAMATVEPNEGLRKQIGERLN